MSSSSTPMGKTTDSPRKRREEDGLSAEGDSHSGKKKKRTGGPPASTPPGQTGEVLQQPSKERTGTGKPRAPTPASRSKSTPRSSAAADGLTILAAGETISKAAYREECQKAKAARSRRADSPADPNPADPNPAAKAADTSDPPKPDKPLKPPNSVERKGKGKDKTIQKQGKPNRKEKASTLEQTDHDGTPWSETHDPSSQDPVEPVVNHPPEEKEVLSGGRTVRPPSLSPLRFSPVPTDVPFGRTERKSSKHPIPPYPTTWESAGLGLTFQQLAFELSQHDPTVGSFTSVCLLDVTKILGQKSYSFVTHAWTLHRLQDHQKQPLSRGFNQEYSPQKLHSFTHLQSICGITESA